MKRNILIVGPPRVGKTTLARLISQKYHYNLISIDDIISTFEATYPKMGIVHNGNDKKTATLLAPFLINYLKELANGPSFYQGSPYVIEGSQIDFSQIMNNIDYRKYKVVSLLNNIEDAEKMFQSIRQNDTEDDWTYYLSDEELLGDCRYFLDVNKYYVAQTLLYNIEHFSVPSQNRQSFLEDVAKQVTSQKNYDEIKTPQELYDYLNKSTTYGWIDLKRNRHLNDLTDFREQYYTMSMEESLRNGVGVCIEKTLIERTILTSLGYKCHCYCTRSYLDDEKQNPRMHCFLLYEDQGKWIHFEQANAEMRGLHKYDTYEEAIHPIIEFFQKKDQGQNREIIEYTTIPEGLSWKQLNQYFDSLVNKKTSKK